MPVYCSSLSSPTILCAQMPRVVHIVLLLCVVLYSLSAPVMWAVYYLESDTVAAAFCVNPDKPACHGKCHVVKLTSKARGTDEAPPPIEQNVEKPLLFFAAQSRDVSLIKSATLSYSTVPPFSLASGYPQCVYHPPA